VRQAEGKKNYSVALNTTPQPRITITRAIGFRLRSSPGSKTVQFLFCLTRFGH